MSIRARDTVRAITRKRCMQDSPYVQIYSGGRAIHDTLCRFGWEIPSLPVVGMLRPMRRQDVKSLSILRPRTREIEWPGPARSGWVYMERYDVSPRPAALRDARFLVGFRFAATVAADARRLGVFD